MADEREDYDDAVERRKVRWRQEEEQQQKKKKKKKKR